MIYTELEDIWNYQGMSLNIDRALQYLQQQNLSELPLGKTVVDGEEIFINRMNYETVDETEGFYEAHLQYLDIHMVIEGSEKIYVSNINNLKETARNEEEDFVGYEGNREVEILMSQNRVLIVFPEDAHMVKIKDGQKGKVQKAVMKVKIDNKKEVSHE